jgi:hypothetical protein
MMAGSSRETARKKHKYRKYDTKYLSFGFTNNYVDGEERPQYLLCMKIFAADRMKQNETVYTECVGKIPEFFQKTK